MPKINLIINTNKKNIEISIIKWIIIYAKLLSNIKFLLFFLSLFYLISFTINTFSIQSINYFYEHYYNNSE